MFTEIKVKPVRYVYEADISNGDTIFIKPDGTADSLTGNKYIEVTKTDRDGDVVHCGWEIAEVQVKQNHYHKK